MGGVTEPTETAAFEPTGHAQVDEAVRLVATLADRPVAEHVGVLETAHGLLREALADAGTSADVGSEPGHEPG